MRSAMEVKGTKGPKAATGRAEIKSESTEVLSYEIRQPSTAPIPSTQYLALVARATNDAVRVWDVKTGDLLWPQGLQSLLGYTSSDTDDRVSFWKEKIHPEDRARATASIAEALRSSSDHWSGEYRFCRADGSYALLLERALIVRDRAGLAQQFVGSLMDITARKQLQDQVL